MLVNNLNSIGSYGVLQVGPNPSGAILFVNSNGGQDSRARVTFPGASATTTNGSLQGPQVNPTFPLATLAYALTFTKAGRGDTIVLQPGHAETLTASVTCANAGVSIIGLGAKGERPVFTMAGFSIVLSGIGCLLQNIACIAGVTANLVGVIQLATNGCIASNIKVSSQNVTTVCFANGANEQIFDSIEVNAGTTGADQGLQLGAFDGVRVMNPYLWGIFATAPINFAGASTNVLIQSSVLNQNSALVKPVIAGIVTACSGTIADGRWSSATADTAAHFLAGVNVATNVLLFYLQNYGFAAKAGPSSGILCPSAGTIP